MRPMDRQSRRLTRRIVLKRGTLAAGALGLSGLAGPASAADISVSGGGDALQAAIDSASPGDTVTVTDSTTYDPITVDKRLSIETGASPTIEGDGGTGAAVNIAADGVTLDGFSVTNPDGLLGVKVERGVDDATIVNNTVENVGPTGRLGVTGIIVGQGDHDGIGIVNNTVQNLDQETTEDSGFPTVNGILFDADNSDPGTVTDTAVNNNVVRDIESDVAPLGIVVQHETDGMAINNNEIRGLVADDATDSDPSDNTDFGFTFAQGINIASPSTVDTTINGNVIEDITSAETILPEAVKVDGDGGGLALRANQFLVAIGLNNRNGERDNQGNPRDPAGDPEVDAKNNWWGSRDGPEAADFNQDADDDERSDVVGNVEFEPFLRNPPGGRGRGRGGGGPGTGNPGRGNGNGNGNPGRGNGNGNGNPGRGNGNGNGNSGRGRGN